MFKFKFRSREPTQKPRQLGRTELGIISPKQKVKHPNVMWAGRRQTSLPDYLKRK